jgi:oxygen-independent coproporphyrinogen-3 oxidase
MEFNSTLTKILEYNKLYSSYYTNYPPVGEWRKEVTDTIPYVDILSKTFSKKNNMSEVSLYIHFPFCHTQCYFCHCHTVISKDHKKYMSFLTVLEKELQLFKKTIDSKDIDIKVVDIHLGGGSPSGMNKEEFLYLKKMLSPLVNFDEVREFSIEIDIRYCELEQVDFLSQEGISRISFGVQDFNEDVQVAINRVQSFEVFEDAVPKVRDKFRGVNFDLIYGMPHQTIESFSETIKNVLKLSPDRIAMYKYNHKPDIYRHQGLIKDKHLPSEEDSIAMNYFAIEELLKNDYIRVGIDHFAKKTDNLGIAAQNNSLRRNFMGYTAGDYGCTIAFGPSAMGDLYEYYVQNVYSMSDYEKMIDDGKFPLFRGYELSKDDIIRREVIYGVMNSFRVDFKELRESFDISEDYFGAELEKIKPLIEDGLVTFEDEILIVTDLGKFCLRNIAVVFDRIYNETKEYKYSKDFIKG